MCDKKNSTNKSFSEDNVNRNHKGQFLPGSKAHIGKSKKRDQFITLRDRIDSELKRSDSSIEKEMVTIGLKILDLAKGGNLKAGVWCLEKFENLSHTQRGLANLSIMHNPMHFVENLKTSFVEGSTGLKESEHLLKMASPLVYDSILVELIHTNNQLKTELKRYQDTNGQIEQ